MMNFKLMRHLYGSALLLRSSAPEKRKLSYFYKSYILYFIFCSYTSSSYSFPNESSSWVYFLISLYFTLGYWRLFFIHLCQYFVINASSLVGFFFSQYWRISLSFLYHLILIFPQSPKRYCEEFLHWKPLVNVLKHTL